MVNGQWSKLRLLALLLCWPLLIPAQQHHSDGLDDVLQHVPMGTVFALTACGVDNNSGWGEQLLTAASSYLLATGATWSLKQLVDERRPDHSDYRSFPSGHATYAFAGATMLHHEYGHVSPWISVGGYGLATLTALHRVTQDRHYLHDVCAGALIGVASTELIYYLKWKFIKSKIVAVGFTGQTIELAIRW